MTMAMNTPRVVSILGMMLSAVALAVSAASLAASADLRAISARPISSSSSSALACAVSCSRCSYEAVWGVLGRELHAQEHRDSSSREA